MLKIEVSRPVFAVVGDDPRHWHAEQIRDFYDSNPDVLLSELARMTGRSVGELKKILMA